MASTLLEPAALAALGISTQPFVAPGDQGLYVDETLDLQIRLLRHNLQYSAMVQVLCGAQGAGKTTLIIRLVDVVNQELELFVARGDAGLNSERIIADMLEALAPGHEAHGDVAGAFAAALATSSEVDTPAALVLDDAHLLSVRELSRLLGHCAVIDQESTNGLRLLLVGTPALREMLDSVESPLLKPGRVFVADIESYSLEQTREYLAQRLASVGASWPFTDEEVGAIHERAEGLPGHIDAAAATTLNHRHAREDLPEKDVEPPAPRPRAPRRAAASTRPRRLPGRPWLLRGVLALVASALLWWLWPRADAPQQPELQPLQIPQPPAPRVVFKDEVTDPPPPAPAPTEPAPATPEPAAAQSTPVTDADAPAATAEPAAPAPAPVAATAPEPAPAPAPARAPAAAEPEPGPARPPASTSPSAAAPATRRGEAWLLAQPGSRYVVQLVAMRDADALRDYVRRHALEDLGAVFSTRRDGAPWHVLVFGDYADADSARTAVARLPAPLRRNSPWIRSFASVHQAIRARTP